jgi:hypothetical protein
MEASMKNRSDIGDYSQMLTERAECTKLRTINRRLHQYIEILEKAMGAALDGDSHNYKDILREAIRSDCRPKERKKADQENRNLKMRLRLADDQIRLKDELLECYRDEVEKLKQMNADIVRGRR